MLEDDELQLYQSYIGILQLALELTHTGGVMALGAVCGSVFLLLLLYFTQQTHVEWYVHDNVVPAYSMTLYCS